MKETTHKGNSLINPFVRPLLIVFSGPSGVGKDTVLAKLKESAYPLKFITTLTTRPRRTNERDNIDYHFVSKVKFQKMIKSKTACYLQKFVLLQQYLSIVPHLFCDTFSIFFLQLQDQHHNQPLQNTFVFHN